MTVPPPPEDDRRPPEEIPDPELNPMTNALLAQNMGRWAEVYFTSPVEKRDEAVQELLRELKSGIKTPRNAAAENTIPNEEEILNVKAKLLELQNKAAQGDLQRAHADSSPKTASPSEIGGVVCPACLSRNKPEQRFCGLCGFGLVTPRAVEDPIEQTTVNPGSASAEPVRDENDWSWLHQKNLSTLAHEQEKKSAWKYVVVLLIVVAGGVAGLWWWRSNVATSAAGERSRQATQPAATSDNASPKEMPQPKSHPASPSTDEVKSKAAPPRSIEKEKATPRGSGVASEKAIRSDSANAKEPPVSADEGAQELEKGRAYLEGRGVPKNSALAAEWLWKSVAKKNTEAVVILSGLYATGDGVAKSCDQARLLLTAAAQKGSDEAREKLKNVIVSCQ